MSKSKAADTSAKIPEKKKTISEWSEADIAHWSKAVLKHYSVGSLIQPISFSHKKKSSSIGGEHDNYIQIEEIIHPKKREDSVFEDPTRNPNEPSLPVGFVVSLPSISVHSKEDNSVLSSRPLAFLSQNNITDESESHRDALLQLLTKGKKLSLYKLISNAPPNFPLPPAVLKHDRFVYSILKSAVPTDDLERGRSLYLPSPVTSDEEHILWKQIDRKLKAKAQHKKADSSSPDPVKRFTTATLCLTLKTSFILEAISFSRLDSKHSQEQKIFPSKPANLQLGMILPLTIKSISDGEAKSGEKASFRMIYVESFGTITGTALVPQADPKSTTMDKPSQNFYIGQTVYGSLQKRETYHSLVQQKGKKRAPIDANTPLEWNGTSEHFSIKSDEIVKEDVILKSSRSIPPNVIPEVRLSFSTKPKNTVLSTTSSIDSLPETTELAQALAQSGPPQPQSPYFLSTFISRIAYSSLSASLSGSTGFDRTPQPGTSCTVEIQSAKMAGFVTTVKTPTQDFKDWTGFVLSQHAQQMKLKPGQTVNGTILNVEHSQKIVDVTLRPSLTKMITIAVIPLKSTSPIKVEELPRSAKKPSIFFLKRHFDAVNEKMDDELEGTVLLTHSNYAVVLVTLPLHAPKSKHAMKQHVLVNVPLSTYNGLRLDLIRGSSPILMESTVRIVSSSLVGFYVLSPSGQKDEDTFSPSFIFGLPTRTRAGPENRLTMANSSTIDYPMPEMTYDKLKVGETVKGIVVSLESKHSQRFASLHSCTVALSANCHVQLNRQDTSLVVTGIQSSDDWLKSFKVGTVLTAVVVRLHRQLVKSSEEGGEEERSFKTVGASISLLPSFLFSKEHRIEYGIPFVAKVTTVMPSMAFVSLPTFPFSEKTQHSEETAALSKNAPKDLIKKLESGLNSERGDIHVTDVFDTASLKTGRVVDLTQRLKMGQYVQCVAYGTTTLNGKHGSQTSILITIQPDLVSQALECVTPPITLFNADAFPQVSLNKKRVKSFLPTLLSKASPTEEQTIQDRYPIGRELKGIVQNLNPQKGLWFWVSRTELAFVPRPLMPQDITDVEEEYRRGTVVKGVVHSIQQPKSQTSDETAKSEASESKVVCVVAMREVPHSDSVAITQLEEGDLLHCKIASITPYALFLTPIRMKRKGSTDATPGQLKLNTWNDMKIQKGKKTITAFCYVSDVTDEPVKKIKTGDDGETTKYSLDLNEMYEVGEEVKAKVTKVDHEKRRVWAGIKPSLFEDEEDDEDQIDDEAEDDDEDYEEEEGMMVDEESEEESESEDKIPVIPSDTAHPVPSSSPPLLPPSPSPFLESSPQFSPEAEDLPKQTKTRKAQPSVQTPFLLDPTSNAPQTPADFERLVLAHKSSSAVWLRYIASVMATGNIDEAREIGQRAIREIDAEKEDERLNVRMGLLGMEIRLISQVTKNHRPVAGSKVCAHFDATLKDALRFSNPKKVYLRLLPFLKSAQLFWKERDVVSDMVKKVKGDSEVWKAALQFWVEEEVRRVQSETQRNEMVKDTEENSDNEDERDGDDIQEQFNSQLGRALQSLPKSEHVVLQIACARAFFASGLCERGRELIEDLVNDHPKRTDLWSVYFDLEEKVLQQAFAETEEPIEGKQKRGKKEKKKHDGHSPAVSDALNRCRSLFERTSSFDLPPKKMQFLLKRYALFEHKYGTEDTMRHVEQVRENYLSLAKEKMTQQYREMGVEMESDENEEFDEDDEWSDED